MRILSLHQNQLRIVSALQSATRILGMTDRLTIVGSLGRFLAGQAQQVGDIDVLIDAELCKRYWDFLEILTLHGITSVFDVIDRPTFPWNYCRPSIAHARALTVDCCANARGLKRANLDIFFKASDLNKIPDSSQWVHLLSPDDLRNLDETARKQKISEDHENFIINDLKNAEKDLKTPASTMNSDFVTILETRRWSYLRTNPSAVSSGGSRRAKSLDGRFPHVGCLRNVSARRPCRVQMWNPRYV